MITEIYEFWFFCPKMAVLWRTSAFPKKRAWNPYFKVFLGWALFGPRCQKRVILKSHPKQRKHWLITEKLFFGIFAVFLGGLLFFLFFCFFLCFFGGLKGQVRWPEGPPHLALNPPYLFFFGGVCFVFLLVFFGGFKGQVRWPFGPPHLALNPPYLFLLFFCFLFFIQKNLAFPQKRAFFVYFQCFSFFLP